MVAWFKKLWQKKKSPLVRFRITIFFYEGGYYAHLEQIGETDPPQVRLPEGAHEHYVGIKKARSVSDLRRLGQIYIDTYLKEPVTWL